MINKKVKDYIPGLMAIVLRVILLRGKKLKVYTHIKMVILLKDLVKIICLMVLEN